MIQQVTQTDSSVLDELRWRGLIHVTDQGHELYTPGLDDLLAHQKIAAYIGFDPTADSLHIGNLLVIMLLVRMQRHGHTPIAIAGGGTGLIGDPGGRTEERQLLTREQMAENLAGIRAQLARFLDFDARDNPAHLVNNLDWLDRILAIDFLRDVGKHFTVNYMTAKESVRSRIDQGISYTEFSYMLLQAYDYVALYDRVRVRATDGRQRPVGQHNHRHRPDSQDARGSGPRAGDAAHHRLRRQQVRKDR